MKSGVCIVLISIFLLLFVQVSKAQTDDEHCRIVENLNFGWLFHEGDIPEAANVQFDDSNWRIVNLPHDFQIEQPWVVPSSDELPDESNAAANIRSRLSSRAFKEMSVGWYRLHFTPRAEYRDKRILIDFGGIMYVGDVYLNGEFVGKTDYGYVGFEIDVTEKICFEHDNVISVRADTREPNDSRWYTGGGLYRNVNLIVTDKNLYFNRHPLQIITRNNNEVSVVFECTALGSKVRNVDVGVRLTDPDGNVVSQYRENVARVGVAHTQELKLQMISVPNAQLWDTEHPNLYTISLALFDSAGKMVDNVCEQFGFRTIEIGPDFGLRLNGQKIILKGIANHHTLGALGAAAYPRAIEKRLQMLKAFGVNHIRTSHNPYSREFIQLCDKYGILVVDELYDKWTRQHTGGRVPWENHWQYDVPEWVKRDRNSPSVVLWSLGNELQQDPTQAFNDYGVTAYKLMRTLLLRYDTTRLTTVAMHPRYRNWQTDSLPCALAIETDVQSYNYRYMYFPGDRQHFPWMTFYQSEASVAAMGQNYFDMELDKVIGLAYWGAIDYLGESQGWPAKGWKQGVFDISLEPKPQAYFMQSFFSNKPMVHIAIVGGENSAMWNGVQTGTSSLSDHWNYPPNSELDIIVYTNADEVELIINGKSMGTKCNNISNSRERNRIRWNKVTYQAGKVEAIARTKGQIVARHTIATTSEAYKLRLTADNDNWQADGLDLQHIRVEAIDRKGRRVPMADDQVMFEIMNGDAQIVAVSSGDQDSDELNIDKKRKLWHGSALVVLRAGHKADKVQFKASAAKLGSAIIELKLKK